MLARFFAGEICDAVFGVFFDTFFVGRQYSVLPPAPQARPVFVSFHFSFSHRLRDLPFAVFRTWPLPFRHLAMA